MKATCGPAAAGSQAQNPAYTGRPNQNFKSQTSNSKEESNLKLKGLNVLH
jgi:hypothetical protein